MRYLHSISVVSGLVFFAAAKDPLFPPVDLGYAVHVPTTTNKTEAGWKFANYDNIRFAHPPLGDLRFRKPKAPPPKQEGVQDGIVSDPFSNLCVGASPADLVTLPGLNGTGWGSEDCLFLNVRVPEGIKKGEKVPVLHWLYGGAYGLGGKDYFGDSLGLYNELDLEGQKFIYVASNYRQGLYGWASSSSEDMDANVGLHDSIAALEWTQKYISKFGGDPEQVTVIGASSGAGIASLMLMGNGGKGKLPFQKVFLTSPGIPIRKNDTVRQALFDEVLKAVGCDSVDCMRYASEDALFKANTYLIVNGTDGKSARLGPGEGFHPVVDGDYIPDLPHNLLKDGCFNQDVKQVVGSNMLHEGMGLSAYKGSKMPDQFPDLVRNLLPDADDETVKSITSLYNYDPEQPDKLVWDWMTDIEFACHAYHIAKAYKDRSKRYVMTLPPAVHAQDFAYYFYYSEELTPVKNVQLAREFQEHLRRFITDANNTKLFPDLEPWPVYGNEGNMFDLALEGIQIKTDDWGHRCEAIYDAIGNPENGA